MIVSLPLELKVQDTHLAITLPQIQSSPYWIALPNEIIETIGARCYMYAVGLGILSDVLSIGDIVLDYGQIKIMGDERVLHARIALTMEHFEKPRVFLSQGLAMELNVNVGDTVSIDEYRSGPPFDKKSLFGY